MKAPRNKYNRQRILENLFKRKHDQKHLVFIAKSMAYGISKFYHLRTVSTDVSKLVLQF